MGPDGYTLLYDGDCRICRAMSRLARMPGLGRRIRVRPILASRELLGEIPDEHLLDAFYIVSPDGRVKTGGDAVPVLIEAFPMGRGAGRLLGGSASLMSVTRRAYAFMARFRDALTCRVGPSGQASGRRSGHEAA